LLHTNLGRAPLASAAQEAMAEAATYCDVEYDLDEGVRASRTRDVASALVAVCGSEAGYAVNNNAAAVMLALAALSGRGGQGHENPVHRTSHTQGAVAVSRGHLVEIGGGFRLPSIMAASGATVHEIGTTNRTHLSDYEQALRAGSSVILLVHRSNFVMSGYVSEPATADIIALTRRYQAQVVLDLGSGSLLDTEKFGLSRELTVPQAVKQGFDAVCFSGDKLLGGPQAGYIVGKSAAIAAMSEHPMARALRCDKVQLAGCLATLALYRRGQAETHIPLWRMLSFDKGVLRARAESWRQAVGTGAVVDAAEAIGGGALPEAVIAGSALALRHPNPTHLLRRLRAQAPAVIGHIKDGRVLLHPRTVFPEDDAPLVESLKGALEPGQTRPSSEDTSLQEPPSESSANDAAMSLALGLSARRQPQKDLDEPTPHHADAAATAAAQNNEAIGCDT
jgi:L-seryl-tRNA(Ser) seleniumtransferase